MALLVIQVFQINAVHSNEALAGRFQFLVLRSFAFDESKILDIHHELGLSLDEKMASAPRSKGCKASERDEALSYIQHCSTQLWRKALLWLPRQGLDHFAYCMRDTERL